MVELAEEQGSPGERDDDVERRPGSGGPGEPDRLRCPEGGVVARRPYRAAGQREPEAPPAQLQAATAGQEGDRGHDEVADGHVKDPGALRHTGQELGQRNPGTEGGHRDASFRISHAGR